MKIWLDDIREPPEDYTVWCGSVKEVKGWLRMWFKHSSASGCCEISLDHDLGENQPTGYDLIKWLEEKVMRQGCSFPKIRVHSANPVGRKNIEAAVKRIEKYLNEKE